MNPYIGQLHIVFGKLEKSSYEFNKKKKKQIWIN